MANIKISELEELVNVAEDDYFPIVDTSTSETKKIKVAYVGVLPIGSISAYGGENIPTNWLKCNGQAISRTTYADLFSVIGTTYGSGDGSTTFNVPNISERVIVGNNGDGEFSLGNTGGEKEHALTINEMPSHTHLYRASTGAGNAESTLNFGDQNGAVISGSYGNAIQNTGGSQAHNNMQPYIALNYIIKAKQSVGVVGTVTSDINDTNDNAVPNAKTVKDYVEEVYSTDEVKTNKIWIDGKPIYRKVLVGTTNASTDSALGSIPNLDTLIDIRGITGDTYKGGITWINLSANPQQYRQVYATGTNVRMVQQASEETPDRIILEYTKTTN